jgi:hypothetical protein
MLDAPAAKVCWAKSFGAPVTKAAIAEIFPKKFRRVFIPTESLLLIVPLMKGRPD